jgi:hypothetical protein
MGSTRRTAAFDRTTPQTAGVSGFEVIAKLPRIMLAEAAATRAAGAQPCRQCAGRGHRGPSRCGQQPREIIGAQSQQASANIVIA